jgi:hypothetical protein
MVCSIITSAAKRSDTSEEKALEIIEDYILAGTPISGPR